MVWPTLISVADVPGPYLGWAITDVETSESVTSAPSATSRIAFPPLLYGESLGPAVQWCEAPISRFKIKPSPPAKRLLDSHIASEALSARVIAGGEGGDPRVRGEGEVGSGVCERKH